MFVCVYRPGVRIGEASVRGARAVGTATRRLVPTVMTTKTKANARVPTTANRVMANSSLLIREGGLTVARHLSVYINRFVRRLNPEMWRISQGGIVTPRPRPVGRGADQARPRRATRRAGQTSWRRRRGGAPPGGARRWGGPGTPSVAAGSP